MKTRTTTIVAALLLSVLPSYARDLHSPDGKFAVRAEATISLIDSSGQPILTLVRNTSGDTKVEVAWSPDSRHVVVVENSHIGSGIVAAWSDGANWHKTIQMDQDQAGIVRTGQAQFHGRLVAEHRKLDGWVTPREVLVKGEMVFSNGGKCNYGYTLAFRTREQVRLDRGGYEEGELVGTNYHLL